MIHPSTTQQEQQMDTTKKYARTLEEAFGPYARGQILEEYAPMAPIDRVILILSAVIITGVIAAICMGVL
jgi:hypothetical protein